jgi:5-formyltetrahydrofolate cyclo-ligase
VALTKAELRRLYTPLGDEGEAAEQAISFLSESVFCFVGGDGECSTLPILSFCLKNSIPLAVPLCEGYGVMTARMLTDLSQLRAGRYGIMEPPCDAAIMEDPAVVIVPGLAFDRDGYRLGRGGGYYDRWSIGKMCRKIGLCRPERLLNCLPRDEWDIPVDMVVTGGFYADKKEN